MTKKIQVSRANRAKAQKTAMDIRITASGKVAQRLTRGNVRIQYGRFKLAKRNESEAELA